MVKNNKFSCCVIGSTKVAIDCSAILLHSGFDIKNVFTDDSQLKEWSESYQISVSNISDFQKCIQREQEFGKFDFLFSIVNDLIIPAKVLASVKILSINYHNGPLPKYAGCNAVNWALIKGEQHHGVSWHVMEEAVDTGEVLAKFKFDIEDKDMLLDVNSKCSEVAVASFKLLCKRLLSIDKSVPVNREHKLEFHKLNEKPTPFCLLPLRKTAMEVMNFFRGTFHQYGINELGVPKLLLPDNHLVVVSKMSILDDTTDTDHRAGIVVSVAPNSIVVSTANKSCISIGELTGLDGTVFSQPFSDAFHYMEGCDLSLSMKLQDKLSLYCERMGVNGRKWGKKLLLQQKNFENELSLAWPYYTHSRHQVAEVKFDTYKFDSIDNDILKHPDELLSSFLIFLICLSPSNLAFIDVFFDNVPEDHSSFFLPFVPIILKVCPEKSFQENLKGMNKKLRNILYTKRAYLPPSDLFLCYPIPKCENSVAICGNTFNSHSTKHKIVVQCQKVGDKFCLLLHYRVAEFNNKSICSFENDFSAFLKAVFLNSSKELHTYPLCDTSKLTSDTLNGPCSSDFPSTLNQPFSEAVKRFPHAIAVIDEEGQYTFLELDRKCDEIANLISVKCGTVMVTGVVLILDRTWLSIAAMLAVLRLGATVIPIEGTWPEHRITQIINDSKPEVAVFASVSLLSGLQKLQPFPRIAFLEELYFSDYSGMHYDFTSENAYIMNTSGTTGKPKGVKLHNVGLSNIIQHFVNEIGCAYKTSLDVDGEYSAHSTLYTFDTFFLEIFSVLWTNGTILSLPANPHERSNVTGFLRYVTLLVTQPVKLAFFDPSMFRSANKIVFGGEAATMELLSPWLHPSPEYQVPDRKLWNAYGPTEGSVITTLGLITNHVHLGKCTSNAKLKILNCNKQAVPIGVPGELHITGRGVAKGYTDCILNETAFWECDGIRCYRTGDLVYLDDQNVLHFLGRIPKDRQVKIGGVRVELFEIEHALRNMPGVQFARVTVIRGIRLVAYVCAPSLNVDDIKVYLAEFLPANMIPSTITFISRDKITFNSSGKLVLEGLQLNNSKEIHSNHSDKIVSILRKCLGTEMVNDLYSSDKSLSAYGVDSISLLHLTNEIKSTFRASLRPSDVANKTLSELCSHFKFNLTEETSKYQSSDKSLKVISNATSFNSISALNQLMAGPTYNVPIVYHIYGQLNCQLLSHALETALLRIRDAYKRENRQDTVSEHTVVQVDLSCYVPQQRYFVAIDLCQRDAFQIIDFKSSLPYLCKLIYLGSEGYILSIVVHHVAFDYFSLGIVEEIIDAVYKEKEKEVEDFDHFLEFLAKKTELKDNSYQYWSKCLKNCELFVNFPVPYSRSNVSRPFIGQRLKYTLNDDFSRRIRDICAVMNIDPVAFFLSLFSLVIYNLSYRTGFGIGVSFSLRAEPKLKNIIGYLTNTLLFCFSPELLLKPFSILLRCVQCWIEESIMHATFPLWDAVKLCKKPPDGIFPQYTPQYIFNFVSSQRKKLNLDRDAIAKPVKIDTFTSKAEIMLDMQSVGHVFEYTWEYSTYIYSLEAMQHVNTAFEGLMNHFLLDINSESYTINLMHSLALSYQFDREITSDLNQKDILLSLSGFHCVFLDKITRLPLEQCGRFHSTASAILSSTLDHQHILSVISSHLSCSDYLCSHIYSKDDTWFLKVSHQSKLAINFESVNSEQDLKRVKKRTSLWPFDLYKAPLFRVAVIEHLYCSPKCTEVFIVAHQVLLNEISVMKLAKSLSNVLFNSQKMQDLLAYSSNEFSTVKPTDTAGIEWIKDLSSQKRMPTLSVNVETCISADLTLPIHGAETEVSWCTFVAVFLYAVTKASSVQFAFLKSSINSSLTFYEEIIPMSLSTAPETTVAVLQQQILLAMQENKPVPYYWEMQEHVDPFLSLSRPYHEVLLHIILDGFQDIKTTSFRPFNIIFTLDLFNSKINLRTELPPQQTPTVQMYFQSALSIFTENQNIRSLKLMSHEVEKRSQTLNVSKLDGLSNSNSDYQLVKLLLKVYESVPNRTAFCYITKGRDCYLTVKEAFLMINIIQCKINTKCKQKNMRVGLLMTNGLELPLSLIATALCQHAFLVLDPTDNLDNLIEKLSESNITCILYDYNSLDIMERIMEKINPVIDLVFIEAYFYEPEDYCCSLQHEDKNNDLPSLEAYVVFTSGTTGKPKLISISEKSLVNFLLWDVWTCFKQQHCIQVMHCQFDVFIAEIFCQFISESTMHLFDSTHRLDPQFLWKIIRHYNINCMYTTPTLLSHLLSQHSSTGISSISQHWNSRNLASLRHVLSAGEKISHDLCALFFKRFPPGKNAVYLHNWGGPSECCIGYAHCIVNKLSSVDAIPMGHLIPNSSLMIVNQNSLDAVVPVGIPGEVLVSGTSSQNQAVDRQDITFINSKPWIATGDVGFLNSHHQLVLLHRNDSQVKIASQRVDLSGIRNKIIHLELPGLFDIIVDAVMHHNGAELVCYLILSDQAHKTRNYQELILFGLNGLFVPRVVDVFCSNEIPLLLSGKINMKYLRELACSTKERSAILDKTPHTVISLLGECLNKIIPHTAAIASWLHLSLDSLGMSSLNKVQLHQMLNDKGVKVSMDSILMSQNLSSLASLIACNAPQTVVSDTPDVQDSKDYLSLIGIMGMGVQYPQSSTCDEFWDIIMNCKEAISHNLPDLTNSETKHGKYIGSRGLLEKIYEFDCTAFGITPGRADMMDPQQRLLLQLVYSTLEETGIDPIKVAGDIKIGCFATVQFPRYLLDCVLLNPERREELVWGNLRDNTALNLGKYFDFRGPCVTLANNCSSLAVAVHYARLSLLNNDCDMAVVVGACLYGQDTGYFTHENDIYSKDGHCCPFSESGSGTVMSDGISVIILKRLHSADEEDDMICLVRGTSVNSDGAYCASNQLVPSEKGQIENLKNVLNISSTHPNTVQLIEAHGTGTKVGDCVEIESLSAVFGSSEGKHKIIGSVKGNFGHLGVGAAGPGIIKSAMALKQKILPPSINCTNPIASLEMGNFKILSRPQPWDSSGCCRTALVHSIGALGTNAAIILEEVTSKQQEDTSKNIATHFFPCCISAQSINSLKAYIFSFLKFLESNSNSELPLGDVLYSLSSSKRYCMIRASQAFSSKLELINWLSNFEPQDMALKKQTQVLVSFSGQGESIELSYFKHYCDLLPTFKAKLKYFCSILKKKYSSHFPTNVFNSVYENSEAFSCEVRSRTSLQQVLTVMFQLAAYLSLESLGLEVSGAFGHSLGEYTAACVAGVFTAEETIIIVFQRALLIESHVKRGKMLSIPMSSQDVLSKYTLPDSVQVSCINSPNNSIFSGPHEDILTFDCQLKADSVRTKWLSMDRAFHHQEMLKIKSNYEKFLQNFQSQPRTTERLLITSIKDRVKLYHKGSVFDLFYFSHHLHNPVDYCAVLNTTIVPTFKFWNVVEIGIKPVLKAISDPTVFNSWLPISLKFKEQDNIVAGLCSMWKAGIDVHLHKLLMFKGARMVTLPTYCFDTQHCKFMSHSQTNDNITSYTASIGSHQVTSEEVKECISPHCYKVEDHLVMPDDSLEVTFLCEIVFKHYQVDITDKVIENCSVEELIDFIVSKSFLMTSEQLPDAINPIQPLSLHEKEHSDKEILFICHAVKNKKRFSFDALSSVLSSVYRVYGVYVPISVLKEMKMNSISMIAAYYVKYIKKIQSKGPYFIGGFSFGAWIAHSVVDTLCKQGDSVVKLVLIDPLNLKHPLFMEPSQNHSKVALSIKLFYEFNSEAVQSVKDEAIAKYFDSFQMQLEYLNSYRQVIQPLTVEVTLLLASGRIEGDHLLNPELWSKICCKKLLKIHKIPGTHSTCLFPLNCIHIAEHFFPLNMKLETFTIADVGHIVGTWKLHTISCHIDEISFPSHLRFNSNGQYTCMVPQVELKIPCLQSNEAAVLNSTGYYKISFNNLILQVEFCTQELSVSEQCVSIKLSITNGKGILKFVFRRIELSWHQLIV